MIVRLGNVASVVALIIGSASQAQPNDEPDTIVVTGSHLYTDSDLLPSETINRSDLLQLGATSAKDIISILTTNTGAENQPDAFTQSATSGTSNVNLRGLGVGSTLVLLNGRRTTKSAATTNTGIAFVDLNALVPDIALGQVDLLMDGAGAVYGSDAIAGVVNFRTRDDVEGLEVQIDYQTLTGDGSSDETKVQVIAGGEDSLGQWMIAAAYSSLSELGTDERRLSVFGRDDVSGLGNPGAFVVSPADVPTLTAPTFVIDPTGCAKFGGIPFAFGNDTGLGTSGLCRFDFGKFFSLVPDMEKVEAYGEWKKDFGGIKAFGEIGYTNTETIRGNSPSFPVLTQPVVPADHPNNPFGIDVGYFGRILGNGAPRFDTPHTSQTWRVATGLSGFVGSTAWSFSVMRAENDHTQEIQDTVRSRLERALAGFGGRDCSQAGEPGVGSCAYFNPFATSFSSAPNDPELTKWLMANQRREGKSAATVVDALLTAPLGVLPGGAASIAVGAQYRRDSLKLDYDAISNANGFAFLIGNPDSSGASEAGAIFTEVSLPVHPAVDVQAALRYEAYGDDIGDSVDPKIAIRWVPIDGLALRGSYATSFRAPSVFQKDGFSTTLNQATDPITGTRSFVANRTGGGASLTPETAESVSVGAVWSPVQSFSFSADYWRIDVSDLIVQESFQSVLNAFSQDRSRVIRAGDPLNGPVIQINTNRLNANSLFTDGVDFVVRSEQRFDALDIGLSLNASYVASYDIDDPQSGLIKGAGNRNFRNIGTAVPQWRAGASTDLSRGDHSGFLAVRYIDSYLDDQNAGTSIPSMTTVDAQYAWDFTGIGNGVDAKLTVGATNLTDQQPPHVATNGGYDSKVHDPRGRIVYVRLNFGF